MKPDDYIEAAQNMETIADQLDRIANAVDRIENSRLTRDALITLICRESGEGRTTVGAVLNALLRLRVFVKPEDPK